MRIFDYYYNMDASRSWSESSRWSVKEVVLVPVIADEMKNYRNLRCDPVYLLIVHESDPEDEEDYLTNGSVVFTEVDQ